VDTARKSRGAPFRLQSIGGRMHAIFFRFGNRIGELGLHDGTYVWPAAEADVRDAPSETPRFAGEQAELVALGFSGWYVIPGEGLAAIFGALTPDDIRPPQSLSARGR
jgi:hypothetical protein